MKVNVVNKSFGEKTVLSSFSLEIGKGERVLLTGPSGCGKTTLMRILAGLDRDFEGFAELTQRPVFLFQEDRLVENISVLSNLRTVGAKDAESSKVLYSLGLEGEERTKVRDLSGGMKRRVAIARLLLTDGDAVFLDEPFRGLDDDSRRRTAAVLMQYLEGKTVVAVSHDMEDAELLSLGTIVDGGDGIWKRE